LLWTADQVETYGDIHVLHKQVHALAAALALASLAAPAVAQGFSDSYTFLKAVRDGDGAKVTDFTAVPGSVVVNSRDRATGEGALHIVTRDRNVNWLAFLLGKGARVDLQNNLGETPLTLAAQLGWTEGAQMLIGKRAAVDLPNSRGETPLIHAVHRRDAAMVRVLMAAGANANRTDSVGYSAIDHAKRDARAAAVVKLLETPVASRNAQGPSL